MRCENFALYHNKRLLRADPCCRSAIKEFAHAFSCAYIELWINLGSLEGRSNISSNQEGSFQIFPLVTSSVNLAAFFIGKCLALCFVIVYRKSARFREPLKKKNSFVLKRENKASKAIKELRLN